MRLRLGCLASWCGVTCACMADLGMMLYPCEELPRPTKFREACRLKVQEFRVSAKG